MAFVGAEKFSEIYITFDDCIVVWSTKENYVRLMITTDYDLDDDDDDDDELCDDETERYDDNTDDECNDDDSDDNDYDI